VTAAAAVPYAGPATVDDALRVRGEHPDWLVLAGGTDVMVDAARRRTAGVPDAGGAVGVLDVFGVPELHGVSATDGVIRIGACTTFAELLAGEPATLPLLHAAVREIGAVQIRNRGTVGGNIVTSSPVGDLLPCLLALDARVALASRRGPRTVGYEQFLRGYRAVDLAADELLVAAEIPPPAPGTVQHWRKVGARAAQAIAKVSVAAAARVVDGRLADVRLAFGGVADRPVRLHAVETLAEGVRPGSTLTEQVRDAVRDALEPITDVRSTADYRRDVAANLAARFVSSLAR
jgi:CO/xanthine dehydrogenase FAD-binding subunit